MEALTRIAQSNPDYLIMPHEPTRAANIKSYSHNLAILDRFAPISLSEMDAVALMNRIDSKYVLNMAQLPEVLAALLDDYWVLEIGGQRLSRYGTLYFDTPDLQFYGHHHMGRSDRYKVRSRSYLDSGLAFVEIKHKTNKGRTIKQRIRTPGLLTQLTPEASQFVDHLSPTDAESLQSTLRADFSRITLVSKRHNERATFDLHLRFRGDRDHAALDNLVIAEIKQERAGRASRLMAQMHSLGIRPTAFSKYCIGMVMLHPEIKHNRFKPILRQVDHIMRGPSHA